MTPTLFHTRPRIGALVPGALAALLAGCGGGNGDAEPPAVDDHAARIQAATSTAQNHSACNAIRPFYWEIGDGQARLASGSVGGATYDSDSAMSIASASKWLYAAYVIERRAGLPSPADILSLTFRSGYTHLGPLSCVQSATIDACLNLGRNGEHDPAADGKFFYDGGHMQRHAVDLGLGALTNAGLGAELQSRIGDFGFSYGQPQPAGGVIGTPGGYAAFLRKLLRGELEIAGHLGSQAVCTNPATCAQALSTPVRSTESWQYSFGHWVEADPVVGDGAFSSAGAFGFYPWIDSGRTWYGIVARHDLSPQAGAASADCGRLIRKAWATQVAS